MCAGIRKSFQGNTNEVILLIVKARDELNLELRSLERQYLEYRQKNPAYSADDKGRSFIARRLDQWDQAMNQALARSLQLKSQLGLGRKLAGEGADTATISYALNQLGGPGGATQAAPMMPDEAPENELSLDKLGTDLASIETQRKTAEKMLAHLLREQADLTSSQGVSDQEIAEAFAADPEVTDVQNQIRESKAKLRDIGRLTRSPGDPSVVNGKRRIEHLEGEIRWLWEHKKSSIAESLARDSIQELTAAIRVTTAELVTLKAKESALGESLDEGVDEELQWLRQQYEELSRLHGAEYPQVIQVAQQITHLESTKGRALTRRPGETRTEALLVSIERSMEAIEVMRADLQGQFDQDITSSKETEISQLEEANLRNNLDRQRILFHSVVDQLKQAQLTSDFGSVSA